MRAPSRSGPARVGEVDRGRVRGPLPRLGLVGLFGLGLVGPSPACTEPAADDPAPVIMRRLSRFEYDATTRDLFGLDLGLARDFPADNHAHGFDVIAEAQALSGLQVELYALVAAELAAAVVADPEARRGLGFDRDRPACDPGAADLEACLDATLDPGLRPLLTRIWRRPPTAAELARMRGLVGDALAAGGDLDEGLALVLEAALLSPHFLFRPEREGEGVGAQPLDPHALASRLAYFLWSSTPDDELLALAAADRLDDDAVLDAQVRRMLADPRAGRLVDAFAGQWLLFRGLGDVFRDAHRYPAYDGPLRASMDAAIRGRVGGFFAGGRDLRDLLRDPVGLVDGRLAGLYRMPAPAAEGLTAVDLGAQERRGILTEPALLTVLARPFATSPARRGRFILEAILCEAPGAPPADAPATPASAAATARERFAEHRADPACAGCHASLDPLGLAFERYDAIGAWRGSEGGALIETADELPGLGAFADASELAERLADDPRFVRCAVRQALTFALGRAPLAGDAATLDALDERLEESGYDLVELLIAIVQSDPFRRRTPQGGGV